MGLLEYVARKMKHLPVNPYKITGEYSVWNGNALNEFEKHASEIELHVVCPHPYLVPAVQEFQWNGIYYHFFNDESASFSKKILSKFFPKIRYNRCPQNRKMIKRLIAKSGPDLVHVIGAEADFYSPALLDVPKSIPTLLQLQTLLNDPSFFERYPISRFLYDYRSGFEKEELLYARYIGTKSPIFRNIILRDIAPNATIINTTLALAESVNECDTQKKFDFVYFAADISKAVDHAIESFILASKTHPGITLDVVGRYSNELKLRLENHLKEYGLEKQVLFEGRLPSHEDVLNQIRLAKFALLPLKIDLISGTIREAMANGLPVITTITQGTPKLNEKRECALLSPIGDFASIAENMCLLLEDPKKASELKENGFKYMSERDGNASVVNYYIKAYRAILDKERNDVEIPSGFFEYGNSSVK